MTDQSPNDQFHASSFMQGHNAEYLEQMYARYASDPNAVDESWQAFFKALGDDEVSVKREAEGPSWARSDWPPMPGDELHDLSAILGPMSGKTRLDDFRRHSVNLYDETTTSEPLSGAEDDIKIIFFNSEPPDGACLLVRKRTNGFGYEFLAKPNQITS